MERSEFDAYAAGICYASVCTSLSDEEATRRLNRQFPTGVSPWAVSENPTFNDGFRPNPSPCPDAETHRHILFSC